jgi:hypothetical protein
MVNMNSQILIPGFILVGWTFLVNVRHYLTQQRAAKKRDVEYRFFKTYRGDAPNYLHQSREHYKNLFQQPVLFYFIILGSAVTGAATGWDIGLAWAYVTARVIHSIIRETTNYVPHRLRVFGIAFFVLVALWVRWGLYLFNY